MTETTVKHDPFLNPQPERLAEIDGQNMYTPKANFWDQISGGFGVGQDWTSIALLKDLGVKRRKGNPLDTIPEDQWNDTHPYYQEDIEWEQDLTLELARNIWETRVDQINYQKLQERGGGGGKFTRGLGIFAGAAWDPINLIAAPVGIYAKAGLGLKMALAGGTNVLVESALQGVAYHTQETRGEDMQWTDAATNLTLAGVIGAAFPVAGRGISRLYKAARGQKLDGVYNKILDDVDYGQSIKSKAKFQAGESTTTRVLTIENSNFNTITKPIRINTKGVIDPEGTIVVTKTNKNTIVIEGKAEDLTKILPELSKKVDAFENITLKVDGETRTVTKETLPQTINELQTQTGVEAKLDARDVSVQKVEYEGKDYIVELDEAGDITGRVYFARKDGKKGKLQTKEQSEAIIQGHQQRALDNKNSANKNNQIDATQDQVNQRTNRSGRNKTDESLNNKDNYNTTNHVDASVSGRSSQFKENHSTANAMDAIVAERFISQKNLYKAGYFLDESGNIIDLREVKLSDLTAAQRKKIAEKLGVKVSDLKVDTQGYLILTERGQKLRTMLDNFKNDNGARQTDAEKFLEAINCRRLGGKL